MNDQKRAKMAHVGAKVSWESFQIIEAAALIRAWPRSKVVELGAVAFANEIIGQAGGNLAALRRLTRQSKARQGGLARAKKRPHT